MPSTTCRYIFLLAVASVLIARPSIASTITLNYGDGDCSGSTSSTSGSLKFGSVAAPTCLGAGVLTVAADASVNRVKLYLASEGTTASGRGATIRIQDLLTVIGGVGSGSLVFDWGFDGVLDADVSLMSMLTFGTFSGQEIADWRACGAPPNGQVCVYDLFPTAPETARLPLSHEGVLSQSRSLRVPFTFGQPVNLDWLMLASTFSQFCANLGGACGNRPVTGSGLVNFYNTALLQPLIVLDSTGAPLSGASVVNDSGVRYAVAGNQAAVPEPSTLLLFGTGGLGLMATLRRRKKTQAQA